MKGRIVIVHSLAHARAALAAAAGLAVPVVLRSAPGAAAYLGAALFREIVEQAAADHPDAVFQGVLDCGADPGHALNALRHGIPALRIEAEPEVRRRIADIAEQMGADLDDDDGPSLDLLDAADPEAACRDWLAGAGK